MREVFTLDRQKVAAMMQVGATVADSVKVDVVRDMFTNDLAARIEAFVLTDQGGPPVVATTSVHRKVKPRWLPRFLWNSIYEEYATVKVTTHPSWGYPSANIALPDLGTPVRYVRHDIDTTWRK